MQTWSTPVVPGLGSVGLPLRLFDSATREVRPTAPGRTARMYVCGITPYDATHMGHAATYVTFDLIHRVWLDAGHDVHYVQNITDVDDPLLERAAATGQDWAELAHSQIDLFRSDMEALRVIPPRDYQGVVESMSTIIDYIVRLNEGGGVYDVDGDLYFAIEADARFGAIAGLSVGEMLDISAERGGDPDRPGKRNPLDCLVWRKERPGEPAWDSPFGRGRPGWHIECVAIALEYLGNGIDIQGGGADLLFPHHELSSSQACVISGGWPFARHFVHGGMVGYEGHKMSKSRGNLVFVSQLLREKYDPMVIRLALLNHHYRDDWEWTHGDLERAEERIARWRQAAWSATGPDAAALLERVRERLTDDLDTPSALAAIDHWADQSGAHHGGTPVGPESVRLMCDALLGIAL